MSLCICADPGCPSCSGECHDAPSVHLYRIDMDDATGDWYCASCAEDALDSGVFAACDGDGCAQCDWWDNADAP